MKEEYLKKYCDLILEVGVNLYPGQCLQITCGIPNYDFALMLAGAAYEKGAKYVDIASQSSRLTKFRINGNINPDYLEYIPGFLVSKSFEMLANDWASIAISNLEEPDELKEVDSQKFGIMAKSGDIAFKVISQAYGASKHAWCVLAVPGPVWASKVLNTTISEDSTNELWNKLIRVLRIDKENPVEEWKKHGEKLVQRSKTLSDMKLDKLIFEGPGTSLEIGLNKNSIWKGGPTQALNGRSFIPNIPTEEVFITPDFKRTNGKVKVTKPVRVMENLLTGIWFEFKDGKVINFGADSNQEILKNYLTVDEGASYLGEVALVDIDSEVFKSGLIFNSILYDENAACHIALGRGITVCFPNKEELITPEDFKKNGCNYSLVHTDFMIGSEEVNVTGVDAGGNKIEIIKNGKFVV